MTSPIDPALIRRLVSEFLKSREHAGLPVPAVIEESTSLIESGMLDSLGFLDLVARIEQVIGRELDFGGADPNEFTTLGGLIDRATRYPESTIR